MNPANSLGRGSFKKNSLAVYSANTNVDDTECRLNEDDDYKLE